jgi:hypothetical protein
MDQRTLNIIIFITVCVPNLQVLMQQQVMKFGI